MASEETLAGRPDDSNRSAGEGSRLEGNVRDVGVETGDISSLLLLRQAANRQTTADRLISAHRAHATFFRQPGAMALGVSEASAGEDDLADGYTRQIDVERNNLSSRSLLRDIGARDTAGARLMSACAAQTMFLGRPESAMPGILPVGQRETQTPGHGGERTLAGLVLGSVREAFSPSATEEERMQRAQSHDMVAEIAADTLAMIPRFRWLTAGLMRSTLLIDPNRGWQDNARLFAGNFGEGVALNRVTRLAMPNGALGRMAGNMSNPLARGAVTHLSIGTGIGTIKAGFQEATWRDADGNFSALDGLSRVGTSGAIGGLINVPAGFLGARIAQGALSASARQQLSLREAQVVAGIAAGGSGGAVFGGLDAWHRGGDAGQILSGVWTGTLIGASAGGGAGALMRPAMLTTESGSLRQAAAGRRVDSSHRNPGAGSDLAATGGGRRSAELALQGGERHAGRPRQPMFQVEDLSLLRPRPGGKPAPIDAETYRRLSFPAEREFPLDRRVEALGPYRPVKLAVQKLKDGGDRRASEYSDFAEWHNEWMREVSVPAREYTYGANKVIVPESYARSLDQVLELRRIVQQGASQLQGDPARMARYAEAATALKNHPLRDRAHPVDLMPFLDEVPDRTRVRRVIMLNEANPEDPWHRATYRPNFESAASASTDGTVTFFRQNRNFFSREHSFHEWAHLLEYASNHESSLAQRAFRLERSFQISEYSKRNSAENWAEHVASLLSPDADNFLLTAHNAPIRTSIYAQALTKSLNAAPTQHRSIYAEQLAARLNYVESRILPEAQARLVQQLQSADRSLHADAAHLLAHLGDNRHMNLLKNLAVTSGDRALANAAFEGALSRVTRGRPLVQGYDEIPSNTNFSQADFLAQMARAGSSVRDRAILHLRDLAPRNERAALFHELYSLESGAGTPTQKLARGLAILDQMPYADGKVHSFAELLNLAGADHTTRVNLALSTMQRNPAAIPDGLAVLAEAAQPRTRPVLEYFAREGPRRYRAQAQEGLARLEASQRFEQYSRDISSEQATLRETAIRGLGELGDTRAVRPLLETFVRGTLNERTLVYQALQNFARPYWKFEARALARQNPAFEPLLRPLIQDQRVAANMQVGIGDTGSH